MELKKLGDVTIYNDIPDEAEGIKRIRDADIVIDNWFKMPSQVIRACSKLQMICVAATGYDWVDMDETRKRKIVVSNSPGYGTEAVGEHTIGLLLHTIRRASEAEKDIAKGIWDPMKYRGHELQGKTLGIIGFGSIGRRVAEIAEKGFDMKILFVNSKSSTSDFEKLLQESDCITINCPLTEKTRGMVGDREFSMMKTGVVIVNTGRGAIVDEQSLISNIESGKVFAVGLDVFPKEPINEKYPLFRFPNVTVTPHIGFNTEEAEYRLSEIVVNNIKNFVENHPIHTVS
ncbi:hypothetical protein A3H86_03720 [Candidatus Roizmanbacteria bacterium RIFCSPLOWO2_02_FULL_41_9]|uniref:Glycerate dehydrogenase n=1 Tax=Candidatus Roizmanbacteria bacterium RIFCSPLOWO2_02_FULL_41_9 TaxID=1802077 RepID=A0A1F7JQL5_9BACT|nr:MAG: hypothetical protein A3H86_03720 [Candidatus Roizmanbacteria bacterium RIFCSPLOWO2_02_FULL_41_9]